jgi:uncharacterized OB-fold protein
MPAKDMTAYMRVWRAKRRKPIKKRRCGCCGHWFLPIQAAGQYCTDHCRVKAWRKRQRDK